MLWTVLKHTLWLKFIYFTTNHHITVYSDTASLEYQTRLTCTDSTRTSICRLIKILRLRKFIQRSLILHRLEMLHPFLSRVKLSTYQRMSTKEP